MRDVLSIHEGMCFRIRNYARGGPRFWVVSRSRSAMIGVALGTRSSACVLMLSTLDDILSAAAGGTSTPRFLCGQLGVVARKPSPFGDIVQ